MEQIQGEVNMKRNNKKNNNVLYIVLSLVVLLIGMFWKSIRKLFVKDDTEGGGETNNTTTTTTTTTTTNNNVEVTKMKNLVTGAFYNYQDDLNRNDLIVFRDGEASGIKKRIIKESPANWQCGLFVKWSQNSGMFVKELPISIGSEIYLNHKGQKTIEQVLNSSIIGKYHVVFIR